jgi:hypothetical protein
MVSKPLPPTTYVTAHDPSVNTTDTPQYVGVGKALGGVGENMCNIAVHWIALRVSFSVQRQAI